MNNITSWAKFVSSHPRSSKLHTRNAYSNCIYELAQLNLVTMDKAVKYLQDEVNPLVDELFISDVVFGDLVLADAMCEAILEAIKRAPEGLQLSQRLHRPDGFVNYNFNFGPDFDMWNPNIPRGKNEK